MDHLISRRWFTKHPLFISALDVEHPYMVYDAYTFLAPDKFKELAYRANAKAQQTESTNTPTTLGAKLVACTAL